MPRLPRDQFEALVRDHHDAVYRAASRVALDSAMAADVAQDVFVRVLQGKAQLHRAESVRATLCWLATMLANNALRARRRRDHHEERAMPRENEERNDPAQLCADTDMHRIVREAVDGLPGDLRVPLLLRCQDELSFASIGTAMRISESTAHERVGRALERLRKALAGRGVAVALAGLPKIVASQPSPAVPADLQARLLGSYASAPLAASSWVRRAVAAGLGAAALGVIAVVANPFGGGEAAPVTAVAGPLSSAAQAPQDPPSVRTEAPEPGFAATATTATPSSLVQQDPAPVPLHVFTGTVHDAAAWPVAGSRVTVRLAGGLKPHAVAETTTDPSGAFRVEFRMPDYGGRVVRLTVAEGGRELLETADLALPGESATPLALVLPAAVGTASSRFQLAVAVCNREGAPLPAVPVFLYAATEARPRPGWAQAEVEAQSGADGTALLSGRTPGPKWLFVDGRLVGCVASFTAITPRVGEQQVRIELAPGRALSGFVARLDGAPIEWANVWLEDDESQLQHTGKLETGGAIAFTGLGDGPYTLHVHAADCSPAKKGGLRPDGPAIDVKLKQASDPRDLGDHGAELHGRLVDAETGKTVSFGAFAIEVYPRRAGDSTLLLDAVEPPGPRQQMDSGTTSEHFHEVHLEAGRWILVARVPGYAVTTREFTLGEHTIVADLEVALLRGAEVHGCCVDAAGQPVQGVSVLAIGVGELADRCLEQWRAKAKVRERGEEDVAAPDPSVSVAWGFTREKGAFAMHGMPPGVPVRLVAMRKGYELAVLPPRVFQVGEKVTGLQVQLKAR
ncbi:MAG TPA: sigma-70 family RNA polymerase sigma factor [Planctomycetota bacterium]|nr:sigma-70 family RNA polymerase sigma factor [Planctomycetota bacterium]